jgi:predicted ArsR family transcriptional regulator
MNKDGSTSTRDEILHILKTFGSTPVNELARKLGITEMAVRRHLNMLERDGLVETTLLRQAMGRPTSLYSLTAKADTLFPKNYHALTLDLLSELEEDEGTRIIDQLFKKRENKLRERYKERMEGKSLKERVSELADIQNQVGYMVEWEPTEEAGKYVFTEYNCPIAQVAKKYNQACNCELSLFRKLLDADVECTQCWAKGGERCVYIIKEDSAKTAQ